MHANWNHEMMLWLKLLTRLMQTILTAGTYVISGIKKRK